MFKTFANAVAKRYADLVRGELFTVDVIDLFETYLAAFPEGTDPIFRVRTTHDCNADKNFIRRLGNVVTINPDGSRSSLWEVGDVPYPYDVVAQRLSEIVQQAPITGIFRTKEAAFGSKPNYDNHDPSIRWEHFYGAVAKLHQTSMPDKVRGERGAIAQVLRRGLNEITPADIDTVLDLIEAKALYRGEEHVKAIKDFRTLQQAFAKAPDHEGFIWSSLDKPAARFRNTVIGTLLVDLAEGVELEKAVKSFEKKVAPENYKRPTALITPKMIEQAVAALDELGLTDAIERRYAVIDDVSVSDVLFVDNEVRGKMKGGLTDLLMGSSKVRSRALDTTAATPISIDDFMALGAKSIELLVANDQLRNFVSLTAPQHADSGKLFKWDNEFAWMYDGELADTGMRDRVKAAGGRVDGELRISLGWFNGDDLDLHCRPPRGSEIYFGNKCGILDVDMNAGGKMNRVDPVENMAWPRMPLDGQYEFYVHQFNRRSHENDGFKLEVEAKGVVHHLSYAKAMAQGDKVSITLTIANGQLTHIKHGTAMASTTTSVEKWGVKTLTPVRVDTIMTSPNFWEGAGGVGNRHWFFMLDGCVNPDATRGFVNEFLRGSLDPHRKVFEVLSSKTKCPPSPRQLSGVGFSSTRRDKVIAIADGRTYEVTF